MENIHHYGNEEDDPKDEYGQLSCVWVFAFDTTPQLLIVALGTYSAQRTFIPGFAGHICGAFVWTAVIHARVHVCLLGEIVQWIMPDSALVLSVFAIARDSCDAFPLFDGHTACQLVLNHSHQRICFDLIAKRLPSKSQMFMSHVNVMQE